MAGLVTQGKKRKRKSIFKLAEEKTERLLLQRKQREWDKANSLSEFSASSWLARRIIQNARLGLIGNLEDIITNER